MRVRTLGLAGAAALLLGGTVQAQTAAKAWLHIRVEEPRNQSKVSVNLPVSVADVALQAAPDTIVSNGHIHLGSHHGRFGDKNMSVSDLRKAWLEVKNTGDAEFATVEDEDETVRVARSGNLMLVHVDKPSGKESVRLEVPVAVVDALFSGAGDDLNISAALTELKKQRGDIVRVKDEDSTVRIWIDEGK